MAIKNNLNNTVKRALVGVLTDWEQPNIGGGGGGAAVAWDLSSATLTSSGSLDLSAASSTLKGLFFDANGEEVVHSAGNASANAYKDGDLSTPWDFTSYANGTTKASIDTTPGGIWVNSAGTNLYYAGDQFDRIFKTVMSTPWQCSSGGTETNADISSTVTAPLALWINAAETRVIVINATTAYSFTMSTPGDLSTLSYDSASLTLTSVTSARAVFCHPTGNQMFILDSDDDIHEYSFNTTLDLTDTNYEGKITLTITGTNPRALFIENDYIVVGDETSRIAYQFAFGPH